MFNTGLSRNNKRSLVWGGLAVLCLLWLVLTATPSAAQSLTIQVCDSASTAGTCIPLSPAGFRWVIEEDQTYHPEAKYFQPDPNTLGVGFHRSYMPVVAAGDSAAPTATIDPLKHYYVSVLPVGGYSIGGALVRPGDTTATVYVSKHLIPTAQIAVFIFEDNNPINSAPDLPAERGLAGFSIQVFDAGGRYGVSGGRITTDAFGNPLGTAYDAAGNVTTMGDGTLLSDANGELLIKYLAPGKYTLFISPPAGEGWVQTSTIEGTKGVDAWVQANEPPFFVEFGPPGPHVFIGFVKPTLDTTALNGTASVSGQVVNLHLGRPPYMGFYNGAPFGHTTPWVGLNVNAGTGRGVFAQRCNPDGTFTIPNVPPGSYQVVVWDDALDLVIAFHGVTVNPDGTCNTLNGECSLGDIPVFQWFTRLQTYVFNDANANGFWDAGETGIPNILVNLRFRDGSLYQQVATAGEGDAPFDEVFPFFHWLVAELDYLTLKTTGVTVVVDDGGPINAADPWSFEGVLNPQPQPDNGGQPYRTEIGTTLLEAFQGFLGQTSVIQWGKAPYSGTENGGIAGFVYYATTRAENEPVNAVWDPWEPGIPRVQVNLYRDMVNNTTGAAGPDGVPDTTTPILTTVTDSWDDTLPAGCVDPLPYSRTYPGGQTVQYDCYDGMRIWNQVRPGVFDGGFGFGRAANQQPDLAPGYYIVEVVPPPGYQIVKEEDKNVDFGDAYAPVGGGPGGGGTIPPAPQRVWPCVGPSRTVLDTYSLFPLLDENGNNIPPFGAGTSRPLCNMKQVVVRAGQNTAVDFPLFTLVPVSGHFAGMILNDLANEFNPDSPQFGEKFAPPWMPVSVRDWTGREISRVYSDEWGRYNGLVPSTYTANVAMPSGMSPNMMTVCLNDPGPIPNPANPAQMITDPQYNPQYSQFCYTFQYMPGTTTYLDTPVLPVSAFAGQTLYPLDCEYPNGTPKIRSVKNSNPLYPGPYVTTGSMQLTILSMGPVSVPNPAYGGPGEPQPQLITRDYGFGTTRGTIQIVPATGTPVTIPAANITAWDNLSITAAIPAGTPSGQLVVTRGDNQKSTINAVTVTVGPLGGGRTVRVVQPGTLIQTQIDLANRGDLILVSEGNYNELVVMWKPVQLQGVGLATSITASKSPATKIIDWRTKVYGILGTTGNGYLLPGQQIGGAPTAAEPVTLFTEEGPGIIVLARSSGNMSFIQNPNARIDGFMITGADHAGAIVVNGYARYLEISNNYIAGNQGVYAGGIRSGHPELTVDQNGVITEVDGQNDFLRIHNNHITQNSSLSGAGAGGGISLCAGSEAYQVTKNFICGNFATADGGGIGHIGYSAGASLIANNQILFNQSFNQLLSVGGGGIFVGGQAALAGQTLSAGSGSVKIVANLIEGNQAGAGDGGGIRASRVSGQDVAASRNQPNGWYALDILNNLIVNNVTGLAGGGIALFDTPRVNILENTIANNDSTATAGLAFTPGIPNQSNAQPAGIVSRAHSAELAAAFGNGAQVQPLRFFSNPRLANSIVWNNRSFTFFADPLAAPPLYRLDPAPALDLAVLGTAIPRFMDPRNCLLTSLTQGGTTYHVSNRVGDPLFVYDYLNGAMNQILQPEVTTAIAIAPAFDEGGNFIDVRYGPLSLSDANGMPFDYHLEAGSPAIDGGNATFNSGFTELLRDYDNQLRVNPPDIGADER